MTCPVVYLNHVSFGSSCDVSFGSLFDVYIRSFYDMSRWSFYSFYDAFFLFSFHGVSV